MPNPLVVLQALAALAPLVPAVAGDTIRRLDGSVITASAADSLARQALADARVTGAQVAVINDGRLVWSASYGLRRRDPALPMQATTTTWAASITKGVFATYVMQLVERGEFDLDLPVVRQLSAPLDSYAPYRETATALVRDSMFVRVTPRMLLAHTSGLRNFAFLEPDKRMHLHFTPGSRYSYSGEGINLVQFVIEQQKGKSLDSLMQDALFGPLEMTRTGLVYRAAFEADVADRYDSAEVFVSRTRRFPARGAGSMSTSAEDLARFAIALLDDRIISRSTRADMLKPFVQIRTKHQFPVSADDGEGGEASAVGLAYGMGWGLLTRTPFGPAFFKEGHGDGAQTYMICFERQRSCMIILTNSDNGELAFRPLLEGILGASVIPWVWEGYTPERIRERRATQ